MEDLLDSSVETLLQPPKMPATLPKFERRQPVVQQPYQEGSTSQGAAVSAPENLGSKDKRRNQALSEPVVGAPHVDALPETEEGHGQAVHQDSAVEVEAGSTKGQYGKEPEKEEAARPVEEPHPGARRAH